MALILIVAAVSAKEMQMGTNQKPAELNQQGLRLNPTRDVPAHTFSVLPTSIITSYYDYMIGSYNSIPMRFVADQFGGGYFMTFHARRQPASQRRVFYTYVDPAGTSSVNEITSVQNWEGYPTMTFDPVVGKPLYSWHVNADADGEYEIQFTSDAFLGGLPGLINDPVLLVDNPSTMTSPSGVTTTNNEFIWPTVEVGPSPIPGKRRVYVLGRNAETNTGGPSENAYIAYADFDVDDIEMGNALTWSYTSIPEMNNWNVDQAVWRRPFHSLAVTNDGNVYYVGYHFAQDTVNEVSIDEPDMDVFICDNYGQGTWTRVSEFSKLQSWNPPASPGGPGYFTDPDNGDTPYPDSAMIWQLSNSSHLNAVVDSEGNLQIAGLWALNAGQYYYPALQFVKQYIYNPLNQTFQIREVYPISENPDDYFQPWDMEAPWGVVDEWGGTPPDQYPLMASDWNFPHWDSSIHGDAMMFHYNNIKISESNNNQMMAIVWQNSVRARWANLYSDPDYTDFANTPEVYISVSPDNGRTWSEPIVLNNVETPQFAGIKPMWVYPADQIKFVGMQGQNKVGRLGIMMYDDYTWGSAAITPPVGQNDGGRVMYFELEIVFPLSEVSNDDGALPPVANLLQPNYPNPFNPSTTITFNMPLSGNANLAVYNVKGQLVKTLVAGSVTSGDHKVVWNGTDNGGQSVSSGVYFYRLTTNGHTETRKMMLMK